MLGITATNDENSIPSSPAISTGSGTPKSKTIEEIYQKKSQLEHILLRPDTYIGSVEEQKQEMWIYENEKIVKKEISFVPGLYKIVDEILVNAADNKIRDPQMSEMRVEVDRAENRISVWNNGLGIPIEIHKEEKIYVPEMIFGHLLTSSNYDDNEEKLFGGRNGYGAKLCNIFSTEFIIRTADKERGLKYEQVFNDNMSKKKAPKITKNSKGEEYTEIIFKPDLSKFGLTELSEDFVKLLQKRAYDMAGCVKREPKPIRVKFNKEKIAINDFKKYAQLYTDSEEPTDGAEAQKKNIMFDDGAKNERWQVGFSISEGQFTQVSFVNSICTSKGGTHVNDVADKIANIIKKKVDSMRKNDKSNIKTFQIKNHMCLFINCLIPNPSFDNQTKDTMNLHRSKFIKTSEYTPSEGFIKKILSSGICDKVIKWAEFKQSQQMTKADGTRIERRINVPKLDDANLAGVKGQGKHCTLILTEGDSAKALVLGGLSVVGKDKFGVFPLRGKLLNVRDASQSQIIGNAEIQHIKTILGLKHGKHYTSVDELRYGSLMIMTDQDHDGSHIKGLIINFIDQMFPSLLDIPGFLLEFITPIIKCKRKGRDETISFYTIPEYQAWALAHNKNKEWTPKYFKGLGTSDRKDAREYFKNLDLHKKTFCVPEAGERELIDMAFNKKKTAERKEWLAQYEPGIFMDNSVKEIRLSNFINQELMLFSMADNIRSIPSMVDGFKPGQRKVLFGTIKSRKRGEMKVAQLASAVSEITRYHHGEQSVQATIVGMAQDFVGSNNINLLVPSGQFGTRHQGGKDAASARYINTKLSKISRTVFHVDDDPLLQYEIEENKSVEPKWYIPILPMVLVNGAEGIGTGWSTSIPNYNPKDIVDNLFRMMEDEEVVPMIPWYRGFKGEISNAGDNKFGVSGIAQVNDDATVTISELPVRMWTRQFKEQLEMMRDPKDKKPEVTIQDFFDNCTDSFVEFTLYLSDDALAKVDRQGPLATFKLQNNITTSNMVCFDSEGRLKRYDSAESILKEFYDLRLSYYQKRKARLLERLQDEYERLDNKSKFIELVIEKKLVYVNRNEQDVIKDFEKYDLKRIYPKKDVKHDILAQEDDEREESPSDEQISSTNDSGYDYLFEINVRGFTRQKVSALRRQRMKKMEEIQICLDKSPKTFWKDDLTLFLKEWEVC
ncbi:hypothetical protein K450DRAFT_180044 [Umbelopsis ramanniana AG]|uniref:DNA topoisomerase 2 n=1 Tax=Umbelopsis ramanniana AG TaxID=1314678 RepID=A0AAD5HB72_UMBRA|nr:uncharacterized protein K450DRAFT_180044 [Umbelopsis ramanniana AG]KAI8575898.1 hypothetical protein K450DRAFT_180044 [Umbelopsis ramanniana AG]